MIQRLRGGRCPLPAAVPGEQVYVCPNRNRDIEPGTGHHAIVPKEALTHDATGIEAADGRKTRKARTKKKGVSAQRRAVAARSERRFDDLDACTVTVATSNRRRPR